MKYLLVIHCLFLLAACGNETPPPPPKPIVIKDGNNKIQASNPYIQKDVSPMDMVYFPADYPVKKMNGQAAGFPLARLIYSRPHRGGRKLFGSLLQWGQAWRLGANEATEIEFFQPVTIKNNALQKGQYIIYAIPFEDKWMICFNRNLYSWGLQFQHSDDVLKVEVPVVTKQQMIEDFTMAFEKTVAGADLIIAWEDMEVRLPIQF